MAGYNYDAQAAGIARKRKLAEALMKTQGPATNEMAGGMVVKNSLLSNLAPVLQAGMGAYAMNKADKAELALNADQNAKIGEWLMNRPGASEVQPVMPSTGFGDPARQQGYNEARAATDEVDQQKKIGWALQGQQFGGMGAAIGGKALESEFSAPDIKYQDAGDSIVVLRNGVEAGRIKKGASPDSALSAQTAMRGQDIGAQTTMRGQDVTMRGQDVGAATATRGQDIAARGQDIGAATATRGQDKQIEAAKIRAEAGTGAKLPVLQSMEYVANQFREANKKVATGGTMGVKGVISGAVDYQDAAMLDNLAQQMSTELRTIFRIPGEGALSDQEQAQYGLQLPGRKYDAAQNEKILNDLLTRARIRLGQSTGAAPADTGADFGGWSITEE